ncbi:MAG: hypothetical protein Sapg2KO_00280 [Saprospiraceae bacterium]
MMMAKALLTYQSSMDDIRSLKLRISNGPQLGLLLTCCLFGTFLSGQSIQGKVVDQRQIPIMAANVFCQNNPNQGTYTNEDGGFSLEGACDTLVVSFIGYQNQKIAIKEFQNGLVIRLSGQSIDLDILEIKASRNVSQEFSSIELTPLEIYLNPNAAADPLKAITTLPYSTNDDETANPALRGSAPNRSRVFLNGVPVERPVRNAQLDGVGFFSIFNTALLDRQVVYPSNPPLNFGNASAGIVELETASQSELSDFRITAGMANLGGQMTKGFGEKGLFQAYGNWQLAAPFLAVNRNSLPSLQDFRSKDVGINLAFQPNEKQRIRFYSYFVDESSEVNIQLFNANNLAQNSGRRNFNILNLSQQLSKGWLSLALGYDWSRSAFQFENIQTQERDQQLYGAINWKHYFSENWILQSGITTQANRYRGNLQGPAFYYAMEQGSPTVLESRDIDLMHPEWYTYLRLPLLPKISVGLGLRLTLPGQNNPKYMSYQANLKYEIDAENKVLFGAGHYNSLANPSYFNDQFLLLKSDQITLEYQYKSISTQVQLAAFHKNESEVLQPNRLISGIEIFGEQFIGEHLRLSLANTFLKVRYQEGELSYLAENDYPYFIKAAAIYNNPKLFNLGLTAILRPGRRFSLIESGLWNTKAMAFEPIFGSDFNNLQLGNYRNVSLSINKTFSGRKSNLILFANVSNVLDFENERSVTYNEDYSQTGVDHFPGLVFYAGFVYRLIR